MLGPVASSSPQGSLHITLEGGAAAAAAAAPGRGSQGDEAGASLFFFQTNIARESAYTKAGGLGGDQVVSDNGIKSLGTSL